MQPKEREPTHDKDLDKFEFAWDSSYYFISYYIDSFVFVEISKTIRTIALKCIKSLYCTNR